MGEHNKSDNRNPLKENKEGYSEDLEKMIEEIEKKAFMAGYDYAIEVLKSSRIKKE